MSRYCRNYFCCLPFTSQCLDRLPHSFPTRRSSDLSNDERARTAGARGQVRPEGIRSHRTSPAAPCRRIRCGRSRIRGRSEEHTSELQSRGQLVSRLLLVKKKYHIIRHLIHECDISL